MQIRGIGMAGRQPLHMRRNPRKEQGRPLPLASACRSAHRQERPQTYRTA